MTEWLATLEEFHFLRPEWLFALLPALIACWWLHHRQKQVGSWDHVISPELLPFLLDSIPEKQRRTLPVIAMIGWLLATLAMAGPTWERTPLPVHKQENALVILFDLSPSMLAQDLKPNRLTRARLKLIDLLQQRKEGTTALIAYSGDSFVVSPLTDDADTVAALVPALDPYIMPSHGSNVEAAIEQAVELVFNTGLTEGNFLLVTDGVAPSAQDTINETIKNLGDFRLSILGIGTEEGAPIPLGNGGFAKDKAGSIVVPRLNIASLKKLANLNGGRYTNLTADDADILYLAQQFSAQTNSPNRQLERTFDSWSDQGYWIVLPLLLILLPAFRRGLLACLLVAPTFSAALFSISMLSFPQTSHAFGWEDLWSTSDQQATDAMDQGDVETAQQQFKDLNWKAAAAYRNGDFDVAKEIYGDDSIKSNTANNYNRGNAQAKSGDLQEAIKSYDRALSLNPDNDDAQFNKELVEKLLQQQQQQQQQQNGDGDSKQQENQSSDSQDQQGEDQQQNNQNDGEESDNDSSQSPSSESSPPESSPPENKPSDQEDSKEGQSEQNSTNKNPTDENSNKEGAKDDQTDAQKDTQTEPQQKSDEAASDKEQASGQPGAPGKQMSDEEKQAMEQWLRRIPDDPGGLLREKFRYESKKRTYERRRGINKSPDQNEERW
jgi:Ca-activated chloride channel homolog